MQLQQAVIHATGNSCLTHLLHGHQEQHVAAQQLMTVTPVVSVHKPPACPPVRCLNQS